MIWYLLCHIMRYLKKIPEFENFFYLKICCFIACPSGLFGLDCTSRCDTYCTGNKSCGPVMGICKEGCKKGLSGLMCGLGIVIK